MVDKWFLGLNDEFSKYGLAEPELVDMDGDFRVNFYRKGHSDKNVGVNVGVKLNSTQSKILEIMKENSQATIENISKALGVHTRTVKRNIKILKSKGVIDRKGADKDREWVIK